MIVSRSAIEQDSGLGSGEKASRICLAARICRWIVHFVDRCNRSARRRFAGVYKIMTSFFSATRQIGQNEGKGMKNKIDITSMVLGALLGAVIVFSVAAATPNRTSWEYKVVISNVRDLEARINTTAADGFEFESAAGMEGQAAFAVLKREKK
jgi:hypothetical protein